MRCHRYRSFVRALSGLLALLVSAALVPAVAVASPENLVVNGDFEAGKTGWRVNSAATTNFDIEASGSNHHAVLTARTDHPTVVLNDARNTVASAVAGTSYRVSAKVRGNGVAPLSGQVRVRQVTGHQVVMFTSTFWFTDTNWHTVTLSFQTTRTGGHLDLNVLAWSRASGQKLMVDDVWMNEVASSGSPAPSAPAPDNTGDASTPATPAEPSASAPTPSAGSSTTAPSGSPSATTKPSSPSPTLSEAPMSPSATSQPPAGDPSASQPPAGDPSASQPAAGDPSASQPATTKAPTAPKASDSHSPSPSPSRTGGSAAPVQPGKTYTLSNGCVLNARGVGNCSAPLVGAAVGGNTDPTADEAVWGARLGVHRTYYNSRQVSSAVSQAQRDVRAGRIPWISFKLPYSWADMAQGKGDAWVKDLVARLKTVDGPVWLAFHHEPEGDQPDITQWTKMQERLGPMVRSGAPNVAFTVILTGWNQLYGPSQYSLANIWPKTTVDVAGFDVYCLWGKTQRSGKVVGGDPRLKTKYFEPISKWAKRKGVAWALAETGVNDKAAKAYPGLIKGTYSDLQATGALAMSYFDSPLNSTMNWSLTGAKSSEFAAVLKAAPSFPKQP